MVFLDYWFFLFVPVAILVVWLSKPPYRAWLLLLAGIAFYARNAQAGPLFLVTAFWFAFFLTLRKDFSGPIGRGAALGVSIALMMVWVALKTSFITRYVVGLTTGTANYLFLNIGAPLAFSYLAFEWLHLAIDRFRGRLTGPLSFKDFALFSFYFPTLAAGPVKYIHEMKQSLPTLGFPGQDEALRGLTRVALGLFKKLVLVETFAPLIPEHATDGGYTSALLLGLGAYLKIYLDLSAYSDIAIGVGRMIGIRLPENMNWPILARSIPDFWRRWHIALTRWFRDYVLFSWLGRWSGKTSMFFATIVTMTLVGAWHGFSQRFLIWGMLNGIALAIATALEGRLGGFSRKLGPVAGACYAFVGWATTQAFVAYGALFFTYPPLGVARLIARTAILAD